MDDSIYYRPRISLAEKYMRHHWKNDKWNSVGIANEALLFVPTDKVERGHMNSERPYVHLSIRPCGVSDYWKSNHSINFWLTFGWCWPNFVPLVAKKLTENGSKLCFLTIIWNSTHTIQFKLVLYSCEVSVEKWFAFGWSWVKMVVLDHYLKKYSRNPNQTWCLHLLGECSELIHFWAMLAKFGPLVATRCLKMVIPDCFLKKYSCKAIQTWCLHILGECSQLIHFWTTLAEFWPSSGQKNHAIGWK